MITPNVIQKLPANVERDSRKVRSSRSSTTPLRLKYPHSSLLNATVCKSRRSWYLAIVIRLTGFLVCGCSLLPRVDELPFEDPRCSKRNRQSNF